MPSEDSPFKFTDAQWEAMAELSDYAVEWGRFVESDPAARDPASFPSVNSIPNTWPNEYWPVFLGPRMRDELENAARTVFDAVRKSLRREHEQGRHEEAKVFYSVDDVDLDRCLPFMDATDDAAHAFTRVDVLRTQDGYKCIECNVAGVLGGWDVVLYGMLLSNERLVEKFAREQGLTLDPQDTFGRLLRSALRSHLGRHPECEEFNFAVIGPEPIGKQGSHIEAFAEARYQLVLGDIAPNVRGRLLMKALDELSFEEGEVTCDGLPVHALAEYGYGLSRPSHLDDIVDAMTAKGQQVFDGPASPLLNDKRLLALVLDQCERGVLDEAEAKALKDYIPWTRVARTGMTRFDGQECSMAELLHRERERLVLKKGLGMAGYGVLLGAGSSVDEWETASREALETGDYIVQEFHETARYPALIHDGVFNGPMVWGQFLAGPDNGGFLTRVAVKDGPSLINGHQGALFAIVFDVDR